MLIDKHPETPSPAPGAGPVPASDKDGKGKKGKGGGDGEYHCLWVLECNMPKNRLDDIYLKYNMQNDLIF